MSDLDVIDVEGVEIPALSPDEARDITNKIRQTFSVGRVLVEKAIRGRVWLGMGYADWVEYCDAELDGALRGLTRGDRQEMAQLMSGAGMSARAIGSVLGVSHPTVLNDLKSGGQNLPPDPDEPTVLDVFHKADIDTTEGIEQAIADGDLEERIAEAIETLTGRTEETTSESERKMIDTATGEILTTETKTTTKKVTGLDGKTYNAKAATKRAPNRKALPDVAGTSGWELRKAVERIERIIADDRFTANKEQVAAQLRSHLSYTVEVCQDLLDQLATSERHTND